MSKISDFENDMVGLKVFCKKKSESINESNSKFIPLVFKKRISNKWKDHLQPVFKETALAPIADALYATGKFQVADCEKLSEGILNYINEADLWIFKTNKKPESENGC